MKPGVAPVYRWMMPRWIAAVAAGSGRANTFSRRWTEWIRQHSIPPRSWRSPPSNPLVFGETARIPARILAVALNVRGATGRELVLMTLGTSKVPSCRLSTFVSRGSADKSCWGRASGAHDLFAILREHARSRDSAAQNMDVIEKRANTDLNVRAVGPLRGTKLETRARFMRQCVPPTSNRGACPT